MELMTVLVIIGILIVMLFPTIQGIREKMERASCQANLRSLYAGASTYITQQGHWPQVDQKGMKGTRYAKDWIAALQPFGIDHKNWICPSQQRAFGNPDYKKEDGFRIDYIATNFDAEPNTAYKWRAQPWFAERAALHNGGPLLICSDGSLHQLGLSARVGGRK